MKGANERSLCRIAALMRVGEVIMYIFPFNMGSVAMGMGFGMLRFSSTTISEFGKELVLHMVVECPMVPNQPDDMPDIWDLRLEDRRLLGVQLEGEALNADQDDSDTG